MLKIRANRIGILPLLLAWLASGTMSGPASATAVGASGGLDAGPSPALRSLVAAWRKPKASVVSRVRPATPRLKPLAARTASMAASNSVLAVSSSFGVRRDPIRGGAGMHSGLDLPRAHGSPVITTAGGRVTRAGWLGGYGNLVEVDHGNGYTTRYGHLSAILVQPGQAVRRGTLIARVGSTGRSTGPHLHYEVRFAGQALNPLPYVKAGAQGQ